MNSKFPHLHYELVSFLFAGGISAVISYGLIGDTPFADLALWMMTGLLFFLLEALRSVVNGTFWD